MECEITDEEGRLVAKASSTCMKLRGERAKGRSTSLGPKSRVPFFQTAKRGFAEARAFRLDDLTSRPP